MTDETKGVPKTRRTFVKKAAKAALIAPAVVMLLNASTKPAEAFTQYGGGTIS